MEEPGQKVVMRVNKNKDSWRTNEHIEVLRLHFVIFALKA